MKNEKLCEYLSDVGVLPLDNIDLFSQIYSSNVSKKFNNEKEKLKNCLFLYFQKTAKDDSLLKEISSHLIETYYNTYIINKYRSLKNLFNILKLKYCSHYNYFITRISLYIIKKTKPKINFKPLEGKVNLTYNELKRNNSDDFIIRKEKNLKIEKLKGKDEKNFEKVNLQQKKKKKNRIKKTNRYKNNYYKNINDEGVIQHGFFVNSNENLDKFDNIDKYNINYNDINNDDNQNYLNYNNYNYINKNDEEINILNYYNDNTPLSSNNVKSLKLPINPYFQI